MPKKNQTPKPVPKLQPKGDLDGPAKPDPKVKPK